MNIPKPVVVFAQPLPVHNHRYEGDPGQDQTMYAWAGSSPDSYMALVSDPNGNLHWVEASGIQLRGGW